MYKYGVPDGVDPVELRKKLDKLSEESDKLLRDPEFQEKVRRNAAITGRIRREDLDKEFTI